MQSMDRSRAAAGFFERAAESKNFSVALIKFGLGRNTGSVVSCATILLGVRDFSGLTADYKPCALLTSMSTSETLRPGPSTAGLLLPMPMLMARQHRSST